jgi:hypothetical protein
MTDISELTVDELLLWTHDERGFLPRFAVDGPTGSELGDLLAEFNDDMARIRDQAEYYEDAVLDIALLCYHDIAGLLRRITECDEAGERANVQQACAAVREWLDSDVVGSAATAATRRPANTDGVVVTLRWAGDADTGVLPQLDVAAGAGAVAGPAERFNTLLTTIDGYSRGKLWIYDALADRAGDIADVLQEVAAAEPDEASGVPAACMAVRQWLDTHVRPTQADRVSRPRGRLRIDATDGDVGGVELNGETMTVLSEKLTGFGLEWLADRVAGAQEAAVQSPDSDLSLLDFDDLTVHLSFDTSVTRIDVRVNLLYEPVMARTKAVLATMRRGGVRCHYIQANGLVLLSADGSFSEYHHATRAMAEVLVSKRQTGVSTSLRPLAEQVGTLERIGRTGPGRDYFLLTPGGNRAADLDHIRALTLDVHKRDTRIED